MSGFLFFILFCLAMYFITSYLKERRESIRPNRDFDSGSLFEHINQQKPIEKGRTFYNSPEWRRLRYKAFKLYGNQCSCCGRSAKDGLKMHVDHIKPRSKYPDLALDISNLQILCEDCNISKGNRDNIKWR